MANTEKAKKDVEMDEKVKADENPKDTTEKEKKYIVGDHGYLRKNGKIYKTGEEISLTEKEFKNVEKLVVSVEG